MVSMYHHGLGDVLISVVLPEELAKDYPGKSVDLIIKPLQELRMGLGAGGKIKQYIVEDENDARLWDVANYKILNVQIINSVDFHIVTGVRPLPTPIDARTYADEGLPFFKSYREKSSTVSGAFDDIKGVVETEASHPGSTSYYSEAEYGAFSSTKASIQFPEQSIDVPIKMLDVDDTVPAFESVNAHNGEKDSWQTEKDSWQSEEDSKQDEVYSEQDGEKSEDHGVE